MKNISVSLDVVSAGEKIPSFFQGLGADSARLSSRKLREGTLWRLEPNFGDDDESDIQQQMQSIFALVTPEKIRGSDIRAYLSIAVFYDTATCSVEIPPICIAMLKGSEISIEISCYPTSEGEVERGAVGTH